MHELALVEDILNTIRVSATTNGIQQVGKIKLVIGKLSMALPDSLEFAFSCLRQDDQLFAEASLEIEERDIVGRCSACAGEFTITDDYFHCPYCEQSRIALVSGRELYIDFFEGE